MEVKGRAEVKLKFSYILYTYILYLYTYILYTCIPSIPICNVISLPVYKLL